MDITPAERDRIARALYVVQGGDSLDIQKLYEQLWDSGELPSSVVEPHRVKAEDFIETMGWVLLRE